MDKRVGTCGIKIIFMVVSFLMTFQEFRVCGTLEFFGKKYPIINWR